MTGMHVHIYKSKEPVGLLHGQFFTYTTIGVHTYNKAFRTSTNLRSMAVAFIARGLHEISAQMWCDRGVIVPPPHCEKYPQERLKTIVNWAISRLSCITLRHY